MDKNWVYETFDKYISNDKIILEKNEKGKVSMFIEVESFYNIFKSLDNTDYNSLVKFDKDKNLGYKDFFYQCKNDGILN